MVKVVEVRPNLDQPGYLVRVLREDEAGQGFTVDNSFDSLKKALAAVEEAYTEKKEKAEKE